MPNQNTPQLKAQVKEPIPLKKASEQVRENEDASLQDDSYSFDSDNTGNEDIHDVTDFDSGGETYDGNDLL